jgi:hypothetical protein
MADRIAERGMLSRRTFIKAAGGSGLGLALYAYLPGGVKVALAQVQGGRLTRRTCRSIAPRCSSRR